MKVAMSVAMSYSSDEVFETDSAKTSKNSQDSATQHWKNIGYVRPSSGTGYGRQSIWARYSQTFVLCTLIILSFLIGFFSGICLPVSMDIKSALIDKL